METKSVFLEEYTLNELDTASEEIKYRLTSPNADIRINEETKKLLQYVQENEGRLSTEIISEYSENFGVPVKSVKSVITKLYEKGVLLGEPSGSAKREDWQQDKLSYRGEMKNLWFRKKLLDTDKYSWLFEKLGFTFSKPFVIAALFSILILDVYFFYSTYFSKWGAGLSYYSYFDYLFLLPLSWLIILFHEIGHSVATKIHDLPMPKGIGVGVYYFMVVFYADTHETWNLSRKKRAVVSTAGVYWNALTLTILIPTCFLIRSAALKDFILLFHISLISALNPFLKMDGYWLLTDLLGVTNLHQKVRVYFKDLIRSEGKIHEETKPFRGYPRRTQFAVLVYGLVYFLFLGAFLSFFLYRVGLIISSFEAEILGRFLDIIGAKTGTKGNIAQKINYLIRNLVILTGAGMLMVTWGRRVLSFFRETKKDKSEKRK